MDSVIITLRHQQQTVDLEVPVSVPFFILAPILVNRLRWTEFESPNKDILLGGRVINSGMIIRPNETLGQSGVVDGDILELTITHQTPYKNSTPGLVTGSYLQCTETGQIFPCRGQNSLIGRLPHLPIVLTTLPHSDAVSRTHANIMRRSDGFWLKDEHSTNGTFVDGYRLKPGERVQIRHDSHIQFGENGPILVFCTEHPQPT